MSRIEHKNEYDRTQERIGSNTERINRTQECEELNTRKDRIEHKECEESNTKISNTAGEGQD